MEELKPAGGGETLFVSQLPLIEQVISFIARRHHLRTEDADELGAHVKLKLLENDYALLRKFQGRSSLRTYLSTVIQRLFLDYRIASWGKWRPSAEAKRLGQVAILLERLLTRDGYSIDEAYEVMTTNHRLTETRAELERLASRLPPRAKRRFESDDVLGDLPSAERPADQIVVDRESTQVGLRVQAALRGALADLEGQDRLILTMRFDDGKTVAEIATVLRLEQKALYRRIDRLMASLRNELEAAGIQRAAVVEMLERPLAGIESEAR